MSLRICANCKKEFAKMHVIHNHITKKVFGICDGCMQKYGVKITDTIREREVVIYAGGENE